MTTGGQHYFAFLDKLSDAYRNGTRADVDAVCDAWGQHQDGTAKSCFDEKARGDAWYMLTLEEQFAYLRRADAVYYREGK